MNKGKSLLICRHAKSSWKDLSLADRDRPLNKRGKRDAPFMGELLVNKGIKADLFVSSDAVRALKTAKEYAKAFKMDAKNIIVEPGIYEAGTRDLFRIIKGFSDEHKTALIFGHNPGFTLLSNFLTDQYLDNIPTAGVVKIDFEVDSWTEIESESGTVDFFEFPKKYRNH